MSQSNHPILGGLFERNKVRISHWPIEKSIRKRSSGVTDQTRLGFSCNYERMEASLEIFTTTFVLVISPINSQHSKIAVVGRNFYR